MWNVNSMGKHESVWLVKTWNVLNVTFDKGLSRRLLIRKLWVRILFCYPAPIPRGRPKQWPHGAALVRGTGWRKTKRTSEEENKQINQKKKKHHLHPRCFPKNVRLNTQVLKTESRPRLGIWKQTTTLYRGPVDVISKHYSLFPRQCQLPYLVRMLMA